MPLDFATQKSRYENLIFDAGRTIFNTRFNEFWNSNYDFFDLYVNSKIGKEFEVEMIPNDFESLKKDKEFLYFIRSLKNQHFWFAERNNLYAKKVAQDLLKALNEELNLL